MRLETALHLLGLAVVFAAGVACFGLFTRSDPDEKSKIAACAGLSGPPRIECERQHAD